MYENPANLQDVCIDYICDNIEALCEEQNEDTFSYFTDIKLTFKNKEIIFPTTLSDQLLYTLGNRKKLTDGTIFLFNANICNLKRVKIKGAPLSPHGMRVLKLHKIVELEASSLKNVPVNDLIGCLGEWTLSNLRSLDVNNGTFIKSGFCVIVSLSKLKNLQTLNVSHTQFNDSGLDIISQDLTLLENLDISGTAVSDLSALKRCKDRLKSLAMYNLRCSQSEHTVAVLSELCQLKHLDISEETSIQPSNFGITLHPQMFQVNLLLEKYPSFPNLLSLDISGKNDINLNILR